MSRVKTALLVAAVLVVAAAAGSAIGAGVAIALITRAYNRPEVTKAPREVTVHSDALGESVTLTVHLPTAYLTQPGDRFPVLWVLDGPSQAGHSAHTAQVLAQAGVGEPTIVVGVPGSGAGRSRDFTPPDDAFGSHAGQADRFLVFLDTEAIPAIERDFRTTAPRLLGGNSLGGLFVTYTLMERPERFDARFAFSPSWWVADAAVVSLLERFLRDGTPASSFFFASLGANEGNRMRDAFDEVIAVLERDAPAELRWRAELTAGADHGDNAVLSLPSALRWYWEGVAAR